MRYVWLLALCACGRIDFADRPDASLDGAVARRCNWNDGPTFGAVTRHPTLDTAEYELDPILVRGDALTIYLGAGEPADIYTATRPSLDDPFGARVPVGELNTPAVETSVTVDIDGTGYMVRASASANIVEIRRDDATFAVVRELTELDMGSELDPWVSPDGLELWFTSDMAGDQSIYIATRATTADLWGNVQPFVYNTPMVEGSASLTADGLVIVWTYVEGTEAHMRYATRANIDEPWSAPQTFPFASVHEVEPSLREDGCELFFATATAFNEHWDVASVTVSTD